MIKKLADRVDALESLSVPDAVDDEAEAARREKAGSALLELIERLDREKEEYAALDASGRIRHWTQRIRAAEAYVTAYSDHPPPRPADPVWSQVAAGVDESLWKLSLKGERNNLQGGECHFGLAAARLDRLAELGYHDQAKMQEWNALRRKSENLPWQWRKDVVVFPEDALALLGMAE